MERRRRLTPRHVRADVQGELQDDERPRRRARAAVALRDEAEEGEEREDGEEEAVRERVEPLGAEAPVGGREGEHLRDAADEARDALDDADGEGAEAEPAERDAGRVHERDEHDHTLVGEGEEGVVEDRPEDAGDEHGADADRGV